MPYGIDAILRSIIHGARDAANFGQTLRLRADGTAIEFVPSGSLPRVFTVSPYEGADFLTLASALTGVSLLTPVPSVANPVVLLLGPGFHTAGVSVPSGVSIEGFGPLSTVLVPPVPTSTILEIEDGCSVKNLSLRGASGVGGVGLRYSSSGDAVIDTVSAINCGTGFLISGATARVAMLSTVARVTSAITGPVGAQVEDGAEVFFFGLGTLGADASVRLMVGLNVVGDNTFVHVVDHRAEWCETALEQDGVSFVEIRGGVYTNSDFGIHTLPSSGQPVVDFRSLRIDDVDTPLLIEAVNAQVRYMASEFNDELSQIDSANVVGLNIVNLPDTDAGVHVRGEFVVGDYRQGNDSVFGEGDDTTLPLHVLSNDNGEAGTWVNNTADAKADVAYSLLQGTGIGNTAYFGSDFGEFPHIYVHVRSAMVLGTGVGVWEYWNGASWVEVAVMATDAEAPGDQYADDVFTRVNHEHIRMGFPTAWTAKTLDGVTAYWLRYRLTAAITTVPTIGLTKIGTNHLSIGEVGLLEHFGDACPERRVLSTRQIQYTVVGSAPGSVNIAFSPSITLNYTNNRLNDGAIDSFGFVLSVPHGLDTSKPLTLTIQWKQHNNAAAGNIQFLTTECAAQENDIVNGGLGETTLSTIVAAPAVQHQMVFTSIELDVRSLLPDEKHVFIVTRDARLANLNDTAATDLAIIDFIADGFFWR